jgi:hypothetical protein
MEPSTPLSSVDRFDLEFPEELPDRLRWVAERLRLSKERVLRLMRLRPAERAEWKERSWAEITERFEFQANWILHVLVHYLDKFHYDVEAALRLVDGFPERVRSGEIVLEHSIPDYDPTAPAAEREDALVRTIHQNGPKLLIALTAFLSQPGPA